MRFSSLSTRARIVLIGLTAAVLAGGVFASRASAATVPRPAAGSVPGMTIVAAPGGTQDEIHAFYEQANHSLITLSRTATGGWGAPQNLGGVLTSGPAAVSFAGSTWVFARGADQAVWYRSSPAGSGTWTRWASLGGRTIGAPGVTSVSPPSVPGNGYAVVLARGTDNALWERSLNGGRWIRLGGRLASSPAPLPDTGALPDVFALGADHAVWEFTGPQFARGWERVGGRSTVAPAVLVGPSSGGGFIQLFVRGTDNALWTTHSQGCPPEGPCPPPWSAWQRQGGFLTSAPTAGIYFQSSPSSQYTRIVLALGGDGALWQGLSTFSTSPPWVWTQVP